MGRNLKIFISGMDMRNPGKMFVGGVMILAGFVMLKWPDTGDFIKGLVGWISQYSVLVGVDLSYLTGQTLDAPTIILAGFGVFGIGFAHKVLKGWRAIRGMVNGPPPSVDLNILRRNQNP
jgi:hypothetical protein